MLNEPIDDLEIQRRKLYDIDRSEWPPVVMTFGLDWEEFFAKQEVAMFGAVSRERSKVSRAAHLDVKSPFVRASCWP